jgi:hypothetical protein
MPDPRNPRIGPSRKHPFAVDPGSAGDDSKFRPVPEPRSPEGKLETTPELEVEVDSRPHLEWASILAGQYVLAENDWRKSIASQGVMEAVWLVATTFVHEDGGSPATALVTAEGSSRTTAVHNLLGVRSPDIPYEDPDAKLRGHYKKLNEALNNGTADGEQQVALRCEQMPALIIVGFDKHPSGTAGFPTAVKSMVALRHVDPPKPWGEGPENESLADEVLDELYRRNLISSTELAYLAGSCTKAEARAAHLSDDPACRAARVVQIFAKSDATDERAVVMKDAIRVAVTSQSTRKNITAKLRNELAAALIVRSLGADTVKGDQVRRYLRHAYGKSVYEQEWSATDRDTDILEAAALQEVRASLSDSSSSSAEPGPASLELAVRAAYPLIVSSSLNADRGSKGNDQPDRRTPGELLDLMRRQAPGIMQLAQALRDFKAGQPIRAVGENGELKQRADGSGHQVITDVHLREAFPPPGKAKPKSGGFTPLEVLGDRIVDFTNAMIHLDEAFKATGGVDSGDGSALVEVEGVNPEDCERWSRILTNILGDLRVWERAYRRQHGANIPRLASPTPDAPDDVDSFESEVAEAYGASYESWDGPTGAPQPVER